MKTDQNILLLGTGTDRGKTYVSSVLINNLRIQGIDAGYFKPVISGGIGDAIEVCKQTNILAGKSLAGSPLTAEDLVGECFEPPYSPHLASIVEKRQVSLDKIRSRFQKLEPLFDLFVIEACGGIFCPISCGETTDYGEIKKGVLILRDVFELFDGQYYLVSQPDLGCINDVVLACEYGDRNNMPISKVVLNLFEKDNLIHRDNKNFLMAWTGKDVITVPTNYKID